MIEKEKCMEAPSTQEMSKEETIAREHSEEQTAALQRAVAMQVPYAYSPSVYGTFNMTSV